MDYIADTLGIKVTAEPWDGEADLPFYLADAYTFQSVTLDSVRCLFVKPKNKLATFPAVKKQLAKIAEHANAPLVLDYDILDARQRKALIAAEIPFVADGNQLYLPFMGVVLSERYARRQEQSETLSPTSQLVLFRYLYQGEKELYANGLAELLGVSATHITRAVKQLAALKLINTRKDGVRIVIAGTENGAALFKKAKPHLLLPVRKRFYVEKNTLFAPDGSAMKLPLAGISALAEYTMLDPPKVTTYAFDGGVNTFPGIDTLVDTDAQAEVEIWRYSPTLLSAKENLPDPLSLWTTLASEDARIETAKDELLAEIWKTE
ncbi:MAG: helix-turn-helix domain-containing protein [Planctomycetota bacterium]|jgi:DNA-binding MarR family transcriptional regulator|nr:helix-turn-helix domain-containing protein [Planctomycetota bacterium]